MQEVKTDLEGLSPADVAWRLLEEAGLLANRTCGMDGLRPVVVEPEPRYRPQDVEAFVLAHLRP